MLKGHVLFFFTKITFLVIVSSQKTQFQRKRLPTATITSASEPPTVDTASLDDFRAKIGLATLVERKE